MLDLRQQLRKILQGRVCVVGVGNGERGDDGLGVQLAELLKSNGRPPAFEGSSTPEGHARARGGPAAEAGWEPARTDQVCDSGVHAVVAGVTPERCVDQFTGGAFDSVLFIDAVDLGAAPGSAVLLNARELVARFPQVSTHRISLGLLAQLIEANGRTAVWLLGVQPETLRPGKGLSLAVAATVDLLAALLRESREEVAA